MTEIHGTKDSTLRRAAAVAERFKPNGTIGRVREYGNGNVNDTFLVSVESAEAGCFILQRINTRVFPRPELIMCNMRTITEHMSRRMRSDPLITGTRWDVPKVFPADDGRDYGIDEDGSFWRAMSFIEGVETFDTIRDTEHAEETGRAVGLFHTLIHDLPAECLEDTLPGFHVTPGYLSRYDALQERERPLKSPELLFCRRFIDERRHLAHVLENAETAGKLRLRPIHGDPKVNNVLVDILTGKAAAIVDLDTVKPGLVQYDIGDCLRSGCNPAGEETQQWEAVRFEPGICRALLRGYLSQAGRFLDPADFEFLFDSVRLIAFELGLRFFTDFLEGNVYFKARYPEHNLLRALVQFRLTESIESQEDAVRAMIREWK
jgi:Ser/Thr protein kinase RdoA (MazF antagonist)